MLLLLLYVLFNNSPPAAAVVVAAVTGARQFARSIASSYVRSFVCTFGSFVRFAHSFVCCLDSPRLRRVDAFVGHSGQGKFS